MTSRTATSRDMRAPVGEGCAQSRDFGAAYDQTKYVGRCRLVRRRVGSLDEATDWPSIARPPILPVVDGPGQLGSDPDQSTLRYLSSLRTTMTARPTPTTALIVGDVDLIRRRIRPAPVIAAFSTLSSAVAAPPCTRSNTASALPIVVSAPAPIVSSVPDTQS